MTNSLSVVGSSNYAAQIVRVPATYPLEGLDNLVGIKVFNSQILTQKNEVEAGDLRIYFPAEVRLSDKYLSVNNLFRDPLLNRDSKAAPGYFETNGRVKAIKLRGHRSDGLLMPLDSLLAFGVRSEDLVEGAVFDTVNGIEISRKYEVKTSTPADPSAKKVKKAFKRVTTKVFPEHIDTDNFFRNQHLLDPSREVIITQKLHGTSIRVGRVPVLREIGLVERIFNKVGGLFGISTPTHAYEVVCGSRKVIKDVTNPRSQHYYGTDIWSQYGIQIGDLIPEGFIVYGELVGWTPDGKPIQKNYTYDLPVGKRELYVYRVARVDVNGTMTDLSWDAVREFCVERGLKHVPELYRIIEEDELFGDKLEDHVTALMDIAFTDYAEDNVHRDPLVPLSDPNTVDEGVCIRQERSVPTILKAKSPAFLEHETKQLDTGEADLESAA
ncbi:RNA ligase [Gordonia phage Rabbitrun]|uniref:RNA ligase n=1 Tax=Gordonia phage Rabbitrun TaxID=2762280 RepID=A0A7G8LIQ3_9CAUD|nr:RNA ligase [Gordonia phage Rabbitrun]QNJ57125.1 RNA ligase [Gordonia phage Rabbitrun]